ncbi:MULTISPECIES: carbohydrate kinase [Thermoanaerobacterium]|uniref:Sugar kinase, ribokinase n=1 Tax=Thermoanaerobacterium thermosaccharolyticum M0795 TaxID=698948 RepID=L0IH30_THETR|nr:MULTISPECIES: carbohydrate kinase [Thermoanaerobacterium]AGB18153.1 sugar kinase, ribokinase [Thermoanaerobacterium thermosaccharolyticum M0795]SNX54413.1 fructokinase [Thermoanaerobacterium sp. RBIITD]
MDDRELDVVALGELLIDFTINGVSERGNQLFEANPGGAPCNVLSMLHNLGKKTSFIGKVGNDQFGILLKKTLEEIGIGTDNLVIDNEVNTTLAFVHTAPDGDRSFTFYRQPGADMMLNESEIREEIIKKARIFHFGTLSMTDVGIRKATEKALKIAKYNNLLISFDPNLRPPLWRSLNMAKDMIKYGLSQCDILKISNDELEFVTDCKTIEEGVKSLLKNYSIKLILVTMGKYGSKAYYKGLSVEKAGFIQENTIDTTGAGDTFCGCILNYVLEHGLDNLTESSLKDMLTFANAAASIITTRRGAMRSMPSKEEIINLLS